MRVFFFFGIFVVVAVWEVLSGRRESTQPKASRWAANLGLVVLNSILLHALFPIAAVGVAVLSAENGWGILNIIGIPYWPALMIAVLALDLAIYAQHIVFHAVPVLWRLHRVHHVDLDYDVTTGLRFHPIEILLSMLVKMGLVALLGASPLAVLVFEILLNGTAMFNHGNIKLPKGLDALLRIFVVTPDMHRVHHSIIAAETNSNFGFNMPWWDRIFGTYTAQPRAGHGAIVIGTPEFRDRRSRDLWSMLAIPFMAGSKSSRRQGPRS